MKRITTVGIATLVLASVAIADPTYVGLVSIDRVAGYYDSTPGWGGGEFTIYDTSLPVQQYSAATSGKKTPANSFQTFCLETNEYIMPPYTLHAELDTVAIKGGSGGGNPDPLDPLTAYLYTEFALGTLSNYTWTAGAARGQDAKQLQKAIWYIEDEWSTWNGTSWVKPDAAATLGSTSKALAWYNEALGQGWTDINYVRVLNLFTNTTRVDKQSQLYLVPVPGAVLLGFLGLGYAGLRLRKMA